MINNFVELNRNRGMCIEKIGETMIFGIGIDPVLRVVLNITLNVDFASEN